MPAPGKYTPLWDFTVGGTVLFTCTYPIHLKHQGHLNERDREGWGKGELKIYNSSVRVNDLKYQGNTSLSPGLGLL